VNPDLPLISIVVPAYNEEANLPNLFDRVGRVAAGLEQDARFEFIVLDNSSTDLTRRLAIEQAERDPRWKYVRYSRNFGAEASLLAGLDLAMGDAVINLFSDLQDPPELIPKMFELWKHGNQVVYGVVRERNDSSYLKTIGARIAYKLIHWLAECKIPENATDFRLMDRSVVNALRSMREPDRYMRGLVHWIGFKQQGITYDRARRKGGSSTANLIYCIRFALHAIACFSAKPMHLAMLFGAFLTSTSILLGAFYLSVHFFKPHFLVAPPPGVTTLILLILFILGVNSLFLGIIGEYVGRIYNQGKGRPLYIVAETKGIDATLPSR
jgi:dolichol-phosphate mannosyltransferase